MEYKRLTQWTKNGASLILDNPQNAEEARAQLMEAFKLACNKLAELEDKIEQGTLIELPCVRERKGYPNQYEAVYEINGVVQSCVVGSVKEGWRIIAYYGEDRAKVEAEKRLKELQNG